MKVAFLCPSISRTSGGIFEIERRLAIELSRIPNTSLDVFAPSDEHAEADLPMWTPLIPQHFRYQGPSSFRYSSGLYQTFMAGEADLAHTHALWMHNSIIVRRWAERWKRPYVTTVNGMLDGWAVRNSGWKKRIAWKLYERKSLHGAACIQVNSEAEYQSVREFGLPNPVCIIPNGVDLPNCERSSDADSPPEWENRIPRGCKVLLYLGRMHPKKGLINLLRAWAELIQSDPDAKYWILAVAGWDQEGHLNILQKLARELRLQSSVIFPGPQFGLAKSSSFQCCDAVVLPSFSEGLPMGVLEAWAYGKPVVMTAQCNLPEGFSSHAAVRVDPTIGSIAEGLRKLIGMPDSERLKMGQNGLALVKSRFSWPKSAAQMRSVYAWILGNGLKPNCVTEITANSRL